MACVADLRLLGWDEWRTKMLEKRRRRWRERTVSLWDKDEVSEEEEVDTGSKEMEVSEDEEENEAGEKGGEEVGREDDGEMVEGDELVEVEEEEKEEENEGEIEVNDEVAEYKGEEVKKEEELEEAGEEGEYEEEDEEDVQTEEEDDEEEEQIGHYYLADQFREQMRRMEDENLQQIQQRASQQRQIENSSDSVESNNEDSDLTGSEDEFYNFDRMKNGQRAAEIQYEVLANLEEPDGEEGDNETVTELRKTQEEEFQVDHEKFQEEEEESTDDEEAEHSMDDGADSGDEDVVKIYSKDDYCTDIFSTLEQFRDSSLLTDLTLSTEDGKSFHVHSPVLAAVSSRIQEDLRYMNRVDVSKETGVELYGWSVSLGPEVDHVGLKAVVEFAYTGLISCLNKKTMNQIQAAAQSLGAPRVLDLCKEEEEKPTKTQEKGETMSAAEQMAISLQSIKKLWVDRVGCDVILEALKGSLHVHRVILAVCCDYFRGMFTSGMREAHQSRVTLPFLLASELEVLIDCSYSGALPLSWRCAFEITTIALQLQHQPALSLCLTYLHQEINPHSCLDVASFAEAYGMSQLVEVADDFVLRQFQKVACLSKFKDLPAKKLLKYLNSRSLCVPSELVVFKAVVAWTQAKPKIRLRFVKELMNTIHFPLMTFKEFKEVQSLDMWSNHGLADLYEAVLENFCSDESQYRIYLPKENLVLIGGEQISDDMSSRRISRDLWFGNSLRNHTGVKKTMEWKKLGEMPEPERVSHEVAVLEEKLYVLGGKKYFGIYDTINSVYRYDPLQNSWQRLADMQEKRSSFSVVVLGGKIYAIGGHCNPEYTQSVEQYCPTGNSWSFTWPLDLPLGGHVAKVLQGQIFVSGGLSSDDQYLSSMFLYHPETGSTYLANMAKPRAHHCMEILGERLYVAGGITADDKMNVIDQLACELYDPAADSWTAFTPLPAPHVGAGSAVLEGKFYVLGGYSQEDYSDTKTVHRFDPATLRWDHMGKMPGPNNDIRASVLCLPPHFRL